MRSQAAWARIPPIWEPVGVWHHLPRPPSSCPHPSLLYFPASDKSARRESQSHENPPPSLGYHGNEHWSRQHLAVVRREGGEGRRRGRNRRGERGEGDQIVAGGVPFQSSSLCLSSVCTVSTLPLLSPSISSITAEWVEIWCSPLSSGFVSLIRRMPLKISEMTSRVIPLLCWECVQLALP